MITETKETMSRSRPASMPELLLSTYIYLPIYLSNYMCTVSTYVYVSTLYLPIYLHAYIYVSICLSLSVGQRLSHSQNTSLMWCTLWTLFSVTTPQTITSESLSTTGVCPLSSISYPSGSYPSTSPPPQPVTPLLPPAGLCW